MHLQKTVKMIIIIKKELKMDKKPQKQPKQQKPKRTAGQMRAYVEVEGEVFPFSMTMEQLDNYQKSLKTQKQSKK